MNIMRRFFIFGYKKHSENTLLI